MVLAFLGAAPGRHYDALKHAGPLAKAKITNKRQTCNIVTKRDFALGPRRVRRRPGGPERHLRER